MRTESQQAENAGGLLRLGLADGMEIEKQKFANRCS